MATAYMAGDERSVSIGRVLGRGFGTVESNPAATLGVAFLFSAVPGALCGYASQWLLLRSGDVGQSAALLRIASAVVGIVLSAVIHGALTEATIAHEEGRRVKLVKSFVTVLRALIPLTLLGLITLFGMVAGAILAIIPAVMIYVTWSVAAPALVAERLSVGQALTRSQILTDGSRWKVFAIWLWLLVASWLLSVLVGVVSLIMADGSTVFLHPAQAGSLPILGVNALVRTVVGAIGGTVSAALYLELRRCKEGPAADVLADIFA